MQQVASNAAAAVVSASRTLRYAIMAVRAMESFLGHFFDDATPQMIHASVVQIYGRTIFVVATMSEIWPRPDFIGSNETEFALLGGSPVLVGTAFSN